MNSITVVSGSADFIKYDSHKNTTLKESTDSMICLVLMLYCTVSLSYDTASNVNKYVRLRGWPYIDTCRSCVHTPHALDRHVIMESLPTLNFTFDWVADSFDFGLLGSKVPQNGRFPAQDTHEPPCRI